MKVKRKSKYFAKINHYDLLKTQKAIDYLKKRRGEEAKKLWETRKRINSISPSDNKFYQRFQKDYKRALREKALEESNFRKDTYTQTASILDSLHK